MSRLALERAAASNTLREPSRLMRRDWSWPPMMMNARCTTTSASATSSATASGSSTSPRRYSVLRSPRPAGSNRRRAIPSTRPLARERAPARRRAPPMSPAGPGTAEVRVSVAIARLPRQDHARDLALEYHVRLDRLDLAAVGPGQQLVRGREAAELLERLDRREHEHDLVPLVGVERCARLVPRKRDGLAAVGPRLRSVRCGREEEVRVEPGPDLRR